MGIAANRKETKHQIPLGAGEDCGRKVKGSIVVEFRRGPVDVAPYLDSDLKPVTEYTEVHIGFEVNKATTGELILWTHDAEDVASIFPAKAELIRRFGALAERAKHTGTTSGTREQNACLDANRAELEANRGKHYETACEILKRHGLYAVPYPDQGEDEVKLYRYGSAWLCNTVPAELESEIIAAIREGKAEPAEAAPDFATEHGLTMTAKPVPANPNMSDGMPKGSRHFLCTIKAKNGATLDSYFSVGPGIVESWVKEHGRPHHVAGAHGMVRREHRGKIGSQAWADYVETAGADYRPSLNDVLECLTLDAAGVVNSPLFEDWAAEYGYDSDSRKAKKVWEACTEQAHKLKRLVGADAFEQLLND